LLWDDIASHLGILNVYTTHTGVLAQNYAQSACLPGLFQRPVNLLRDCALGAGTFLIFQFS
jgi:hypothetical protein